MCFAGNAALWGVVFVGRLSPAALDWFPRCVGATLAGKWPLLLLLGVVKSLAPLRLSRYSLPPSG